MAEGPELVEASLRRPVEQLVVVGDHEVPIGRHARVGVVDDAVLEREGDPARTFGQSLLEVRTDLLRPVLEPVGRLLDQTPEGRPEGFRSWRNDEYPDAATA